MDIRRLAPSDASACRALRLRALRECPTAFTSSHDEEEALPVAASAQRLADADHRLWGAFHQNELVGMVGFERELRSKNRHKARVIGMYVAPERTGRGTGAALLQALIADASGCGLALLVLTVTEDAAAAARLYQRCGFRRFGTEPRALKVAGRFYAKHHMYLELPPS